MTNNYQNYELYNLQKIPQDKLTFETCIKAFQLNPSNFKYIPDEYKTSNMVKKALDNDLTNIKYVPDSLMTTEIAIYAFNNDYRNIKYIPFEFRSKVMCEKALKKDFVGMWKYVPASYKGQEEYDKIFKLTNDISFVPTKFQTQDMWNKVFKNKGWNINDIPVNFRTSEMLKTYNKMHFNGRNYQELLKEKDYLELLENDPVLCFKRCEPYLRTRELYEKLIKIDVLTYIKNVPVWLL